MCTWSGITQYARTSNPERWKNGEKCTPISGASDGSRNSGLRFDVQAVTKYR